MDIIDTALANLQTLKQAFQPMADPNAAAQQQQPPMDPAMQQQMMAAQQQQQPPMDPAAMQQQPPMDPAAMQQAAPGGQDVMAQLSPVFEQFMGGLEELGRAMETLAQRNQAVEGQLQQQMQQVAKMSAKVDLLEKTLMSSPGFEQQQPDPAEMMMGGMQ
jgi:hypothetical protein